MSVPYLVAIVFMVAISVSGMIVYGAFVSNTEHGAFIGFISAMVGPIMLGLLALIRTEQQARLAIDLTREAREAREEAKIQAEATHAMVEETHKLVNSELEEFKRNLAALERAEGREEGMKQGREDAEARTDALRQERDNPEESPPHA